MSTCTLLAPAKINLYLEIIGDRPDNYHELAMILQSISLTDRIDLQSTNTQTFKVYCDHPQVPTDQSNLAYRAGALMGQQFPEALSRYGGFDIKIQKNIPIGAGLAGGSTDAAAVLVGIDLLWKLGLTKAELETLGAHLGSDVPFCIAGGTILATGRGEQLSPLPDLDHLYVVLAKYNSLSISTAWAYKTYRQEFEQGYIRDDMTLLSRQQQFHSGPMVSAILQRDGTQIGKLLHNDLEKVVLPAHPKIQQLRQILAQQPEVFGAMMSGSGPTVFALCHSQQNAETIVSTLLAEIEDPDLGVWVAHFNPTGIQLHSEI